MSEAKIQSKIIKYLKKQGRLVIKLIRTNYTGVPDICCFKKDKVLWIEVKTESGVLSKIQIIRHKEILTLTGNKVMIPYGYDDFLDKYNERQI